MMLMTEHVSATKLLNMHTHGHIYRTAECCVQEKQLFKGIIKVSGKNQGREDCMAKTELI